jgi:hypothetical protein
MKKLLSLISLCLVCILAAAQGQMEEVVYLKNGTSVRGMIMEYVPNVSIKIKAGKELTEYKLSEIEKITREKYTSPLKTFVPKSKGYYGIVSIGATYFPERGGGSPMGSITVINGYQFSPYLAVGGGVGADISANNIYNAPVFLDIRSHFLKGKTTPYIALAVGYNATIDKNKDYYSYSSHRQTLKHGAIFAPSFGVKAWMSKKAAISVSLGYKLITTRQYINIYSYSNDMETMLSHSVTFMIGIHF